jgi:hypothetical protein
MVLEIAKSDAYLKAKLAWSRRTGNVLESDHLTQHNRRILGQSVRRQKEARSRLAVATLDAKVFETVEERKVGHG